MDNDIIATKPTIQIQGQESNIHDQIGAYNTTKTLARLQWLCERFDQNQMHHIAIFQQPHSKTSPWKSYGSSKDVLQTSHG
jgi:hypothetical protein